MILKIKISPMKYKGYNKDNVLSKLNSTAYTFSNYGNYRKEDENYVYVYNLEKHRRKTKQTKVKKGDKLVTKSTVVNEGYWLMFVYKIPKYWLIENRKKVDQCSRNFKIVDRK